MTRRHDIYGRVHKGLRAIMGDTLVVLGRADPTDECDMREAATRLEELLVFCEKHAAAENEFVHRAIEERRAEASCELAREHAEQAGEIAALRELSSRRDPRLHRQVAVFVAKNLLHMEDEENRGNALLWELFSDEEIVAIERRLVASRAPGDAMQTLRWMLPAMNPAERAAMLAGLRAAPPAVFEGVLGVARTHLSARDFGKLEHAIFGTAEA